MINSETGNLKSSNDNNAKKNAASACPICKAPASDEYLPFCSKRCADVDLHRWLSGSYAIPAQEDESDGAGDTGDG